jgi:hypothetical protein
LDVPEPGPTLDDLCGRYPRWEIGPAPLEMVAAERREGREVRYLAARTLSELEKRLAVADAEEETEP